MKRKMIAVIIMFVVLLALIVVPVMAQSATPVPTHDAGTLPPTDTFGQLLVALLDPAFLGITLTFILREWLWFQGLESKYKWLIVIGLSVAIPMGARLLLLYLPDNIVAVIDQIYPAVRAMMILFSSGQVVFAKVIKEDDRKQSVFAK